MCFYSRHTVSRSFWVHCPIKASDKCAKGEFKLFLYLWQPLGVPGVSRDDLLKPLETVVDGWLVQRCRRETESYE